MIPLDIPRLQPDHRLGGMEQWRFATDNELMKIPKTIRKCVAFVGCTRKSGPAVVGTAFFVGFPIDGTKTDDTHQVSLYAVTARHVIDDIKASAIDHQSFLRMNRLQGPPIAGLVQLDRWVYHEDDRVDVAACAIGLDFEILDHYWLPVDSFLSKELAAEHEFGVGQELFFPGLFKHHYGEERNIPIIRLGSIAAVPEEPIATRLGKIRAYLVEARSIRGLSGSPAFICTHAYDHLRLPGGSPMLVGQPVYFLLGMVQGHFGVSDTLDSDAEDDADIQETKSVNMGIALVVPADDVLATLNHPKFLAEREAKRLAWLKEREAKLPELD